MNILLLGMPGSGKGTQARLLADRFDLRLVGVGDVLREIAKGDAKLADYLREGRLVPDDRLFEIITAYLERRVLTDNLLFDGFPRSRVQFHAIRDWFAEQGTKIDLVVFLDISEKQARARLVARKRIDDRPEVVRERFSEYRRSTQPLLSELKDEGILVSVKAEGEVAEIHKEIVSHVKRKT